MDALTVIMNIMRASVQLAYTPNIWRKGEVKFIPKPGKRDPGNPRSYRPITLTSFLFKTLERITLWELESTIMKEKPFHRNQHAFRMGFSCDTALAQATETIEKGMKQSGFTLGVFLDIKGAFDNVKADEAIRCLERRNTLPHSGKS